MCNVIGSVIVFYLVSIDIKWFVSSNERIVCLVEFCLFVICGLVFFVLNSVVDFYGFWVGIWNINVFIIFVNMDRCVVYIKFVEGRERLVIVILLFNSFNYVYILGIV